ncbi:MAG: ABC transporter permease, partial [Cyclobacteriaceae bacterium]|nr:ABC transporter permease [Cyclobacteriaceae bacterium]
GDPVSLIAGQRSDISTRKSITKELGLDKPLHIQFLHYVNDLSFISIHEKSIQNQTNYDYKEIVNLGKNILVIKWPYMRRSFQTNKKVTEIIYDNIDDTFWLAFSAMLIASVLGITLGIIAALNQNTWLDHLLISVSVLGISIPSFVSAIVMAMVFGYYLSDYTGLNLTGQLWVNHPLRGRELQLQNLILPAITLGIRPLAIIVQLTRSSMLEVLSLDYIRTAYAKGLNKYKVVLKHALKNGLNPVITTVSGWLASLMAGAFFVEYIFDWKGLGFTTIKAVQSLDFPVVMGVTLVVATFFIIINIFVDLLYAAIDPRIRLS